MQPYALPCNRIARATGTARLMFKPRLHAFKSWKLGITRREIYTGHCRAFFGLAFIPVGLHGQKWAGIGVSFPICLYINTPAPHSVFVKV